ncbi:MANSC domain-containing protein 4 [Dendrobates tinctorius]|uniref:MANSC domain-containing protein 4 n=1 Tax=Dendrobates tinctorius TaxID=92724 RepID=UPI003CC95A9B
MAVSVESVSLLLLSLLDVPWICSLPSALCPHTAFYHGCWIRRFPGLVLSFSGSEQRGARLLLRRPEPSAQKCSHKCCHQDSCNVAVFYSETSAESGDCHLVHCPEPESCLLQLRERSVLYTVTAGVDPDLLVFDQLRQIDLNPRSSLKWERLNISREPPTLGHSKEPQSLPTSPHDEPPATQPPPPQPPSPADSPLRSLAPTYSPPITAQDTTPVFPQGARLPDKEAPPSSPPLDRPELQSPAHLDSSKQHVNETKGHGGRNQTYDGETEDPADTWANLWPLPTMIGSTVTLLCCCSGVLAFGCCRRRQRGRYRPWRAPMTGTRTLITCTLLKEKD